MCYQRLVAVDRRAPDGHELQLSYLHHPSGCYVYRSRRELRTLHLDAAVSTGELAPGAVADTLLDGAGAWSAAVGRRSDDPPTTSTSAESTSGTTRRPRQPVVSHDAVHRCAYVQNHHTAWLLLTCSISSRGHIACITSTKKPSTPHSRSHRPL